MNPQEIKERLEQIKKRVADVPDGDWYYAFDESRTEPQDVLRRSPLKSHTYVCLDVTDHEGRFIANSLRDIKFLVAVVEDLFPFLDITQESELAERLQETTKALQAIYRVPDEARGLGFGDAIRVATVMSRIKEIAREALHKENSR